MLSQTRVVATRRIALSQPDLFAPPTVPTGTPGVLLEVHGTSALVHFADRDHAVVVDLSDLVCPLPWAT